jgi:hypothetical protein
MAIGKVIYTAHASIVQAKAIRNYLKPRDRRTLDANPITRKMSAY